MRRAKDDARRKRRTTVIDSSQCQYSPDRVRWFYGSFMACRPAADSKIAVAVVDDDGAAKPGRTSYNAGPSGGVRAQDQSRLAVADLNRLSTLPGKTIRDVGGTLRQVYTAAATTRGDLVGIYDAVAARSSCNSGPGQYSDAHHKGVPGGRVPGDHNSLVCAGVHKRQGHVAR